MRDRGVDLDRGLRSTGEAFRSRVQANRLFRDVRQFARFAPVAPPPLGASLRASVACAPIWGRFLSRNLIGLVRQSKRFFACCCGGSLPMSRNAARTRCRRKARAGCPTGRGGSPRLQARPARVKRRHGARLAGAELDHQLAAGREQPAAHRRRSPDRQQGRPRRRRARARGSWSRTSGASAAMSPRRDIGRIRDDEIEARPAARAPKSQAHERRRGRRGRARRAFAARTVERRGADVGADAERRRQLGQQREQDRARAGAEIGDAQRPRRRVRSSARAPPRPRSRFPAAAPARAGVER